MLEVCTPPEKREREEKTETKSTVFNRSYLLTALWDYLNATYSANENNGIFYWVVNIPTLHNLDQAYPKKSVAALGIRSSNKGVYFTQFTNTNTDPQLHTHNNTVYNFVLSAYKTLKNGTVPTASVLRAG